MNKSKAKRLRKDLEHEQAAADRGHAVQLKRLAELRRRKELALVKAGSLTIKQLTPVQMAVHVDLKA